MKLAAIVVAAAVWLTGMNTDARAERVDWSQYIEDKPSSTAAPAKKLTKKKPARVAKAKAKAKKHKARGKRGARRR